MSIRLVQIVWNLVAGIFVFRGGYHVPSEKEQRAMESDEEDPRHSRKGESRTVPVRSGAAPTYRRQ